jgi:alpha-tubulin suppressor-like RCC1 family protein
VAQSAVNLDVPATPLLDAGNNPYTLDGGPALQARDLSWLPGDSASDWVAAGRASTSSLSSYRFHTGFTVTQAGDMVRLRLRVGADDHLREIRVNNALVWEDACSGEIQVDRLRNILVETRVALMCGVNNLDFGVQNTPMTASGLRVEVLEATVHPAPPPDERAPSPSVTACPSRDPCCPAADPDGGCSPAVSQLALGANHSCALMAGGTVCCWGDNKLGQQGAGTTSTNDCSSTGRVKSGAGSLDGVVSLASGLNHLCAVVGDGGVLCWGSGQAGQLGFGVMDGGVVAGVATPQHVPLPEGATQVAAAGDQTCALMQGGGIWCWGDNRQRQLGNGSPALQETHPVPLHQEHVNGWTRMAAGLTYVCMSDSDGGIACAGDSPFQQALTCAVAAQVDGLPTGALVAAGNAHACSFVEGGTATCVGANPNGELGGDGGAPLPLSGMAAMAAGAQHTCAVHTGGAVSCWGGNNTGQLGATGGGGPAPQAVMLPEPAHAVYAGQRHTCVTTVTDGGPGGNVFCFGDNSRKQSAATATPAAVPTPVIFRR